MLRRTGSQSRVKVESKSIILIIPYRSGIVAHRREGGCCCQLQPNCSPVAWQKQMNPPPLLHQLRAARSAFNILSIPPRTIVFLTCGLCVGCQRMRMRTACTH